MLFEDRLDQAVAEAGNSSHVELTGDKHAANEVFDVVTLSRLGRHEPDWEIDSVTVRLRRSSE